MNGSYRWGEGSWAVVILSALGSSLALLAFVMAVFAFIIEVSSDPHAPNLVARHFAALGLYADLFRFFAMLTLPIAFLTSTIGSNLPIAPSAKKKSWIIAISGAAAWLVSGAILFRNW